MRGGKEETERSGRRKESCDERWIDGFLIIFIINYKKERRGKK